MNMTSDSSTLKEGSGLGSKSNLRTSSTGSYYEGTAGQENVAKVLNGPQVQEVAS